MAGEQVRAARRAIPHRPGGRRWALVPALPANRLVTGCLVLSAVATGWFVLGPAAGQVPALRLVTAVLAGLASAGAWRINRNRVLPGPSARFWRILALALSTFTTGMAVDLGVFLAAGRVPQVQAGEVALYPIAGLFALAALVAYPTVARGGLQRVKIGLDVAIVLFASATFVWYFLVSPRWRPTEGWWAVPRGAVLPALTLVAGFAVLRLTSADTAVVTRTTLTCFLVAAFVESATIVLDTPAETVPGRFSSILQTAGLLACVLGVEIQRVGGTGRPTGTGRRWRRPFTLLPYGAVVATLTLLLLVVDGHLSYRGWVVVGSVLALCPIVMLRQMVSLWENSRLLAANEVLAAQLRHQAFHDHLTGLANRSLFAQRVSRSLARTRADGGSVAVLFIDLDDFKAINDTLGHHTGDELLAAVARRLEECLPAPDVLGRLGGDEFAVLVEDASGDRSQWIAEIILAALRRPFPVSGTSARVGASVGLAVAHQGEPDTNDLLRNADVAMYTAKRADRGGYRAFDPTMFADLLHRHRLRAALADAVEQGAFVVHYQPIVDLTDGVVRGAEALVRWRGPEGTLISPTQFIPLAEESGLIAQIDRWVLREACGQASRWLAELGDPDGFSLHVNLSARQLHRPDLAADVGQALREHGLRPGQLTLEITESGLGYDQQTAVQQLRSLAELGVHLAIDDFGTGYSSLSYLRQLPVNVLKIDKTFTDELRGAGTSHPLAQAVIALASALGMRTVAEGIEEPAQAGRLLALGCQYGQGFHYGEALPGDQMGEALRSAPGRSLTTRPGTVPVPSAGRTPVGG